MGYGLTETSPVVCNQLIEHRVRGTIGTPVPNSELKIVNPDTLSEVPPGHTGILMVKSPGVTSGYLNNPAATKAAFDDQGFFDTGDLVRMNLATGDVIMTGRAKDTIVLFNGENVAPQPIEDALVGACPLVDQAMLVGQDKRSMSAVLVSE